LIPEPSSPLRQSHIHRTADASRSNADEHGALAQGMMVVAAMRPIHRGHPRERVDNATASDAAAVGTAANSGAFAGIFRRAATGAVFSQGTYEFSRVNGDIIVAYKWRDTVGNENFDSLVLRADDAGKLGTIGNQYAYGAGTPGRHAVQQHQLCAAAQPVLRPADQRTSARPGHHPVLCGHRL
jgi:hypothetical protein